MRNAIRVLLGLALAFGLVCPGFAAGGQYLFEQNIAKFKDIKKVESRSFKFLASFDQAKSLKDNILVLRDLVKKAGAAKGYAFKERKKGEEWRYSEKHYYDTPARDLYKKGYVIRQNYRFKEGDKPDPEKFVLTVKEMSASDFLRLANSKLGPVPGSDSLVKFEENVSLNAAGRLQSYFESAIGSKVGNKELGEHTLGDYAKLYPELARLGIPATVRLSPVVGYSIQLKFGSFKLPGGGEADMDIEMWSVTPGGKPFVAEIAFETDGDEGYASAPSDMKAAEDFFLKVFGDGMKSHAMPGGGPYMGSKVRVLFDQKNP
jgi:hypothetical protein